jgi:hypothetical protein
MGLSVKVGSFNLDSTKAATETQAITGVGFQPKVVLFWFGGSTSTGSDACAGGSILRGFGIAISSSERGCIAGSVWDAAGTSEVCRSRRNDGCILVLSNGSASTQDGYIDFVSMDSDGFTLIYDDAISYNLRISYMAIGGTDLTNYKIGEFSNASSNGNFSVTGVGFQPDAVCIFSSLTASGTVSTHDQFNIGWATGSSNQGLVSVRDRDGVNTMQSHSYGYNGECIGQVQATANGATGRGSFVSMDSDGFTINSLEAQASTWVYLALKGGQYTVGDLLTQTDTTTDISESLAFQPSGILFLSAARALSTQDAVSADSSWSLGGYDGTNQIAQATFSQDNTADSETTYAVEHDNVYINISNADAVQGLMKVISRSSTGFVCEMSDDADPSQCWVTYLAIGPSSSSEISGSVVKTLDDVGKTIAGQVTVSGFVTKTLDDVGKTIAGQVVVSGSVAKTLDDATLDADGVVGNPPISGSLIKTLDDVGKDITGRVLVTGYVTNTLDNIEKTITGQVTVSGSLAKTLGDATLDADGTVGTPPVSGSVVKTLDDVGKNITGQVIVQGSVSKTLDNVSGDITGTVQTPGSIVITDTISLADVVNVFVSLGISDVISIADNVYKVTFVTISDLLSIVDAVTGLAAIMYIDDRTILTDDIGLSIIYSQAPADDNMSISDNISVSVLATVTDTITIGDAISVFDNTRRIVPSYPIGG